MYKPAPYLTHQSSPYQLELLRIRTQHTIHIIPSHLHYAFRNPRADYQDRVCPYCLASGTRILGDELHIICQCPTTKVVLDRFTVKFQRLTRLLDLPSLTSSSAQETTRLVLGNPPPQILHKDPWRWIQEATPPALWICVCPPHTHHIPTTCCCWHVLWWRRCSVIRQPRRFFTHPPPPWLPTCIHTTKHHHAYIPRPRKSTAYWASYPL